MAGWQLVSVMIWVLGVPGGVPIGDSAAPPARTEPSSDGTILNPDTRQDCLRLAESVEATARRRAEMPADNIRQVRQEIQQGRELCAAGHVRPGVLKLRWALKELGGY